MLSATSSGISQPSELDSVEAIGTEIVNEISVFCYLISIDTEMFGNDVLNSITKSTHRFSNLLFLKVGEQLFGALHEVDQAFGYPRRCRAAHRNATPHGCRGKSPCPS
jgi:hypothetical protein